MSVLFVKQRGSVSEPPFERIRSNVCDLSLARWKGRGRLLVGKNCIFLLVLTVEAVRTTLCRNRLLLKWMGNVNIHF